MAYTTIDKPTDYFNTKLYTGTGTFPESISGVGFSPEFIWIKRRNATASHVLSDIIRGTTKTLYTDSTSAELTNNTYGWVSSFDSDGFSVDQSGSSGENVNASGSTYASWNWLAGGTASSNTDGSITSSVSANTTAGFSIVKWTETSANSQTIGHGLGTTPSMIITKLTDDSNLDWYTFHQSLGTGNRVMLNSTSAKVSSGFFNGTLDSNVFHVGYGDSYDNKTAIAYCFAEKKGYSKFGSYTGNGSSDGTFVYTGFKPAFVIIKNINSARNWIMFDNKRDIDNVVSNRIFPNSSSAQNTNTDIMDFLSNGFKLRTSSNLEANESGDTLIYMAFAENPFVTSTGIPTTAR